MLGGVFLVVGFLKRVFLIRFARFYLFLTLLNMGNIGVIDLSLFFLWCVSGFWVGFILKYLKTTGSGS